MKFLRTPFRPPHRHTALPTFALPDLRNRSQRLVRYGDDAAAPRSSTLTFWQEEPPAGEERDEAGWNGVAVVVVRCLGGGRIWFAVDRPLRKEPGLRRLRSGVRSYGHARTAMIRLCPARGGRNGASPQVAPLCERYRPSPDVG